jgi:hypothetical protein
MKITAAFVDGYWAAIQFVYTKVGSTETANIVHAKMRKELRRMLRSGRKERKK